MAVYGYIRKDMEVSFVQQLKLVQKEQCDEIFVEEASFRVDAELERLLEQLEVGDTLVVPNLVSFGKSLQKMKGIFELLAEKKIRLVSHEDHLDSESTNLSFYQLVMPLFQMDRQFHALNTQEGLTRAKEKGVVGGRPRVSEEKIAQILYLHDEKNYTIRKISEVCGVSAGTVHKYLKSAGVE